MFCGKIIQISVVAVYDPMKRGLIGRLVYDGALALKCDSGRGSFQIEWRIFL